MILTGKEIQNQYECGRITIDPFVKEHINANSYDVTLGNQLLRYNNDFVDTAVKNEYETIVIPESGLELKKGEFYVGHISEIVGSDFYVPIIHGKKKTAQLGLFVHVTANLIDVGNKCNFSLHLVPTTNIKIYPNTKIAHVSFWVIDGNVELYNGKYKGVIGAAASQSYKHNLGLKK